MIFAFRLSIGFQNGLITTLFLLRYSVYRNSVYLIKKKTIIVLNGHRPMHIIYIHAYIKQTFGRGIYISS